MIAGDVTRHSLFQEEEMKEKDYACLTAPCGLDCFNCQIQVENITEETKQQVARSLKCEPESVPCGGCRSGQGCKLFPAGCETYRCTMDRQVDFCFQCTDFPCSKLQPAREGADRYPHNFKVYNLCRIQAIGLEEWAREESSMIRRKYFLGKFVPGSGPILHQQGEE